MIDPEVQELLTVQDRDTKKIRLEKELAAIPAKIDTLEGKKTAARDEFEEKKSTLRALEVRRKDLENELGSAETQVAKYKNQQLSVKKNEEYQALTHEIEKTQTKISDLETQELEVMMEIDEESERVKELESTLDGRLAALDSEMAEIKEIELNLKTELEQVTTAYEDARGKASTKFIRAYDQAKRNLKNRPPFVAPIEDGMCRRSHLKVSQETIEDARVHGTPHFCDVTGCVIYIDT